MKILFIGTYPFFKSNAYSLQTYFISKSLYHNLNCKLIFSSPTILNNKNTVELISNNSILKSIKNMNINLNLKDIEFFKNTKTYTYFKNSNEFLFLLKISKANIVIFVILQPALILLFFILWRKEKSKKR